MKGIVSCIRWEHLSSVSLPKSPNAKYTKSNVDLLPSQLLFVTSVEMERFSHFM